VDPDSELITASTVTAGNVGDAAPAPGLLVDDLATTGEQPDPEQPPDSEPGHPADPEPQPSEEPLSVYGDSAYGTGALLSTLEDAGAEVYCKVQPPVAPGGRFPQGRVSDRSHGRHGQLPCRQHGHFLREPFLLSLSLLSTVGVLDLRLNGWIRSLAYLEMIFVASLAGGAASVVARRASRRADEIASQLRLEREG